MTAALPGNGVRFSLGSGGWWRLIAAYIIRGGVGIDGGVSSGEQIIILGSGGQWRLVAANGVRGGGGISGGWIAAMSAASAPSGGRSVGWGLRREVAGEGDLMLTGGVAYCDAGLQPGAHASLI